MVRFGMLVFVCLIVSPPAGAVNDADLYRARAIVTDTVERFDTRTG